MGNTYNNITIKGPTYEQIATYLDAQQQAAFITPTLNELTFVYGPDNEWSTLAEELSRSLECPALFTSVYDGDVLEYILYVKGIPIDEYNSAPDYFDGEEWIEEGEEPLQHQPEPTGGNAGLFCTTFGVEQAIEQVDSILHPPIEGAIRINGIDAFHQHWALAEALGWPPLACIASYRHLEVDSQDEDLQQVFGGQTLLKTPL